MKKIDIKVIVITILLTVSVCVLTFLFFQLFTDKETALISNLEISFNQNDDNTIDYNNIKTYEKSENYKFKIKNKGETTTKYKVVIVDNSKEKTSIDRSNLNYELYLNNRVLHHGRLSQIEDDTLDVNTVKKDSTNSYSIRIWVDEEKDTQDKVYKYYLKVVPVIN